MTTRTVGVSGPCTVIRPPRVVEPVVVASGAGSTSPAFEGRLFALKTLGRDGAGESDGGGVENEEEVGDREHVVNSMS